MNKNSPERLHAIVYGRVQGVGFRAFAARNAQKLGLTGWVRNRFNGTVETVAEGDHALLERYLRDLKSGPGPSNVTQVDQDWSQATMEFDGFKVRMTR